MTVLALLVKVSNLRQLKQVDDLLKVEFENLDLDLKVLGAPVNKWVQVSLSGGDEVVAANYIDKEIGTCPISIKRITNFSFLRGYITKVDAANDQLMVDVGIFEPKTIQASIPLDYLQVQLAGGKKVPLAKVSELYGLRQNLPLSVKLVNSKADEDRKLEAELSDAQIEKIRLWQESLLDRLIVLGATRSEIEKMIQRIRLNRDVIATETLGLFEHALTCKLGTDAAGLIPKIGRFMRNVDFIVFDSKKSLALAVKRY